MLIKKNGLTLTLTDKWAEEFTDMLYFDMGDDVEEPLNYMYDILEGREEMPLASYVSVLLNLSRPVTGGDRNVAKVVFKEPIMWRKEYPKDKQPIFDEDYVIALENGSGLFD